MSDEVLADLRARIRNTRWPGPAPGAPWEQGTNLEYLQGLLGYWADGFDWGAQERWLNGFGHFRADIDGLRVHFVHERARSGRGIPLILTNGWPSCLAEFLPLVPLLTDPAAHGIDGPGFDLVIPSLPGERTGGPVFLAAGGRRADRPQERPAGRDRQDRDAPYAQAADDP